MQISAVNIRQYSDNKVNTFSPNNLNLKMDYEVVVETGRGLELGKVVKANYLIERDMYDEPLKSVIRLASESDIKTQKTLRLKSRQVVKETEQVVKQFNLDMNIVNAEISLDEAKITINFTSDNRVDFRELVKTLGLKFRSRIELRQIGTRDEVKVIGGMGPCGQVCCCKRFLKDFEHVSIKMPKIQGLSLNPNKISGLCGKLMCCLAYENNFYNEAFRQMPRINSMVITPEGKATVVYNNILKGLVLVRIGEKENNDCELKEFKLEEVKILYKNSVGLDDDPGDKLSDLDED